MLSDENEVITESNYQLKEKCPLIKKIKSQID